MAESFGWFYWYGMDLVVMYIMAVLFYYIGKAIGHLSTVRQTRLYGSRLIAMLELTEERCCLIDQLKYGELGLDQADRLDEIERIQANWLKTMKE